MQDTAPRSTGGLTLSDPAARTQGLTPGQIYDARVTRVDGAQVELELADRCLLADTPYRFRVGDRIALRLLPASGPQLSFQLSLPADDHSGDHSRVDTIARAAGIRPSPGSRPAVASLLEHGLAVLPENVADLGALQQSGCEMGAALLTDLQRLWTADLRPGTAQLATLAGWRAGRISLSRLLSSLPDLQLEFAGGVRMARLADYAIIGAGGSQAGVPLVSRIITLLHAGPGQPEYLGNLLRPVHAAAIPALRQLLDLLELQCMLCKLDSPMLRFCLPFATSSSAMDVEFELRPLGLINYRPRFSCHIRLDCPRGRGAMLQAVSEDADCRLALMSGDPGWLSDLLAAEPVQTSRGVSDWPIGNLPQTSSDTVQQGLAARIPAALHKLIARLAAVIYERC